jgi:alanine-synthesizing transaminase
MFSRVASGFQGETNALYSLRDQRVRQGHRIRDLISANINEQGYSFPPELLEDILGRASRTCAVYRPDSLGSLSARSAVSDYYRGRGLDVSPGHILLTPGTSFSYWYCFKLLADEGDEILCPRPSYPLFDYIALLCGVRLVQYDLVEDEGWALDIDQLEASISTRTRAIVLISPHNPTGRVSDSGEISRLAEVAARHDLAILSDEVFSDFLLEREELPCPLRTGAPLVFTLNGFSKMFALPGVKFGWMALSGEEDRVARAMRSLELMSDTFLPVNEIIQAAAADIFRKGESLRGTFGDRVRKCWEITEEHLKLSKCFSHIRPQGGVYVTLRLHGIDEEKAAMQLLERNNILLHPGYFYDMPEHHLVLCFVQEPEVMRSASRAFMETLPGLQGAF